MLDFYKGKKVFITGHTGFKGSWLCKLLANAGADVTGYSLNPPTSPSLFEIANIESDVKSVIGDIRDFDSLKKAFDEAQPEIVLHLAAQPIVRDSYKMPAYTYETNVMEALDGLPPVKVHCSVLAEQAIKAAVSDYYKRRGVDPEPIVGNVPECDSCGCEG